MTREINKEETTMKDLWDGSLEINLDHVRICTGDPFNDPIHKAVMFSQDMVTGTITLTLGEKLGPPEEEPSAE